MSSQKENISLYVKEPESKKSVIQSNFSTFFSIICAVSVGCPPIIGVSFKQAGWISILLIFATCLAAWYTGVLLIECLYYKKGVRLESFPDIGQAAFGRPGRITLQFFHYTVILSIAIFFIKLEGSTFHVVTKYYGINLTEAQCTIILAAVLAIPYVMAKNMKELTIISILGLLTVFLTVFAASGLSISDNRISTPAKTTVVNWKNIPSALGSIGFAFGGNIIFPHIEAQMTKPQQWRTALGLGFFAVMTLYLVIGISGYAVYGNDIEAPINANLPSGLTNIIVCCAIAGHLVLTLPFYLISFSTEVETLLNIDKSMSPFNARLFQIISRCVVVIVLTLAAIYTQHCEVLMPLIGAISNLVVLFITPIVLHLKLFGLRRHWSKYLPIVACFILGVLGGVVSIIDSIKAMVAEVQKNSIGN